MKLFFGILIGLTLVVTPGLAQKVTIDYAHDFDFGAIKSFQYVDTKDSNATDPLMAGRIEAAIVQELKEGGLMQVDTDPGLFVTYHFSTKDDTVYNTTSYGYGGMGAGWGRWGAGAGMGMGMGSATTTATTFTEGTLIMDAYEPGDKKMVWRGTGTVTLKAKPEKQTQQIDAILDKMGAKWDKILKNQGK